MRKITIVGAGRVGESTAQILAQKGLARKVVLTDIREGAAEGAALDIQESAPLFSFDTKVVGSSDAADMRGSDLIIVTAGMPRKEGMSRSDVLDANIKIADTIIDDVLEYAPDAMLILVSNPVDVLTYYACKKTGWDRSRVFGQAGVLDAARMASFLALETKFSVKDITTMVLGGHGDTMVPLPRFTCVNGIPISHFLAPEVIDDIIERTRHGGAEILALRKNSTAYDAPAAAIATMVDAIVHDRKRLLPCVAMLEGEFGEQDIAMGVPVVLGAKGMEKVIDLDLEEQELQQFKESAASVRADLTRIN